MSSPAQALAAAIKEEQPRSTRVMLRLQPGDAAALDQFAAQSTLTRGEACRALVRSGLQLAAAEEMR